jgi:hypothetical protein
MPCCAYRSRPGRVVRWRENPHPLRSADPIAVSAAGAGTDRTLDKARSSQVKGAFFASATRLSNHPPESPRLRASCCNWHAPSGRLNAAQTRWPGQRELQGHRDSLLFHSARL